MVIIEHSTEALAPPNWLRWRDQRSWPHESVFEALVVSLSVIVRHELRDRVLKLVQRRSFGSGTRTFGAREALRERIQIRGSRRRRMRWMPASSSDRRGCGVMPAMWNGSGGDVDEEQDVMCDETLERVHLDAQKVRRSQALPVSFQKRRPSSVSIPLRGGLDAVFMEDVGNGAASHVMSQKRGSLLNPTCHRVRSLFLPPSYAAPALHGRSAESCPSVRAVC